MKEAIGNAVLFNIIITFVVILMGLFVSSLAYSKAYKVKNKIVEEIEKERTYNDSVQTEIDKWLNSTETGQGIGYRTKSNGYQCPSYTNGKLVSTSQKFQYCVYEMTTCTGNKSVDNRCGKYYHVVTYMYLELPLLDLLEMPVTSETMTFIEVNS